MTMTGRWAGILLMLGTVVVGAARAETPPAETPPAEAPPRIAPRPDATMWVRARVLVLDRLEFRDQPLAGILDEIVERSREADPSGIGVNVIVRLTPEQAGQRLTLNLRDVTVERALRLLATTAGLLIRYDERAIIVRPDPRIWR